MLFTDWMNGPVRQFGYRELFGHMDTLSRDNLIRLVGPIKGLAFNFKNASDERLGSIGFRRPPGVWSWKKTKHWIAFGIAFWQLAFDFSDPGNRNAPLRVDDPGALEKFERALRAAARKHGVEHMLDRNPGSPTRIRTIRRCM